MPVNYRLFLCDRFTTVTQLRDAVENMPEVLHRAMEYCNYNTKTGRKFFESYLRSIMETSLLYRLYPADAGEEK